MKAYEELVAKLDEIVAVNADELIAYSDDVADHPELGEEEFRTSQAIKTLLEGHGWQVELPFAGWPTGFRAIKTSGHGQKLALLTEYDALPGMGHACGHCVSGAMSILAGLALSELADDLDLDVHVIGTPAEETVGAKIGMSADGVFDEYDAAIMVHIDDKNQIAPILMADGGAFITFHGKSAHASAAPWEGVNALNAVHFFFHAIDMIRQHSTPIMQYHGVILEGGTIPGIVPDKTVVKMEWRSQKMADLDKMKETVEKCAEGAAVATGCTFEMTPAWDYFFDLKPNATGEAALTEIYDEMGYESVHDIGRAWAASDVGNVSYSCPAFQPTLKMLPVGTGLHTPEVEACVRTEDGHKALVDGAKIMGRFGAKIFGDPEKAAAMKADFAKE